MTREEHIARHKMLHEAVDELFADFVVCHPDLRSYLNLTIKELLDWSYKQTQNPDDGTSQKN